MPKLTKKELQVAAKHNIDLDTPGAPTWGVAEILYPNLAVGDAFYKYAFNNLEYMLYKYSSQGNDGKISKNCISKAIVINARRGMATRSDKNQIAVHMNFTVTAGRLKKERLMERWLTTELNLQIKQCHITARSLASQRLIDESGESSILLAAGSIHRAARNGWDSRADGSAEDNLGQLAAEIEVGRNEIVTALDAHGFNQIQYDFARRALKTALIRAVRRNLGSPNCVVTFEDSDNTFDDVDALAM